jgi:hypothetical protein
LGFSLLAQSYLSRECAASSGMSKSSSLDMVG